MGPPLSARQLPWLFIVLGLPFLALGIVSLLASLGVVSPEWAAPVTTQAILLGMGLLYVVIGVALIWKHSRLTPGTPEYDRLHKQKDWHPHVTEAAIAYWVGFGALLVGFALLGVAEGSQGACYRGAPNPCQFSLSPGSGLEFWGTLALVVCPIWFVGYGVVKLVGWQHRRRDEAAVRDWLDEKGPLK